ncbi:MAG: hypothetical protein WBF45_19510, partial [Acidobacteriaceae bacterium]
MYSQEYIALFAQLILMDLGLQPSYAEISGITADKIQIRQEPSHDSQTSSPFCFPGFRAGCHAGTGDPY